MCWGVRVTSSRRHVRKRTAGRAGSVVDALSTCGWRHSSRTTLLRRSQEPRCRSAGAHAVTLRPQNLALLRASHMSDLIPWAAEYSCQDTRHFEPQYWAAVPHCPRTAVTRRPRSSKCSCGQRDPARLKASLAWSWSSDGVNAVIAETLYSAAQGPAAGLGCSRR